MPQPHFYLTRLYFHLIPLFQFASIANSSRSIQTPNQYLRPSPNSLTHKLPLILDTPVMQMEDIEAGAYINRVVPPIRSGLRKWQVRRLSYGESSDDLDDDLQTEVDARVEEIEVQEGRVRGARRGLRILGEEIR